MTADLLTIPARDQLASLIGKAIAHREPGLSGCCSHDRMCPDHEHEAAVSAALRIVQLAVEKSRSDEEALNRVRSVAPHVIAEITGATKDQQLKDAIGDGADGGEK